MSVIPAVAGVLGMAGGALDYLGDDEARAQQMDIFNQTFERQKAVQDRDYQFNVDEAWRGRHFAQLEAQRNRDFQERMSSSAYQRARGDMEAAGFNPMLMFRQGGAATPGGATAMSGIGHSAEGGSASAPMVRAAKLGGALRNALNSAIETRRLKKELDAAESVSALNEAARKTEKFKADVQANSAVNLKEQNRALKLANEVHEAQRPALLKQAQYDLDYAGYDALIKRVQSLVGAGSSAAGLYRNMFPKIRIEGESSNAPYPSGSKKEFEFKRDYYKKHPPGGK